MTSIEGVTASTGGGRSLFRTPRLCPSQLIRYQLLLMYSMAYVDSSRSMVYVSRMPGFSRASFHCAHPLAVGDRSSLVRGVKSSESLAWHREGKGGHVLKGLYAQDLL